MITTGPIAYFWLEFRYEHMTTSFAPLDLEELIKFKDAPLAAEIALHISNEYRQFGFGGDLDMPCCPPEKKAT